ncbi:MAG TPA: AlpA family phage regulatory protein [Xanthobacteraceae bacterium]|nr:AlpA family phage regulatory protein [Xanthobacteraceae bacterium]
MNAVESDRPVSGKSISAMITAEEVLALIHISRTTLYRLEVNGLFPRGHALTPHLKLWFYNEIIEWQEKLKDPNSELSIALREMAMPKRWRKETKKQ